MKIQAIVSLLLLTLFISCKKEADKSAPHLITGAPYNITYNSVKVNGSGIDNGPIIEKGFCWSDSKTPDINDNKLIVGEGDADFEGTITGLEPSHAYYIRAYATNKYRTGYGAILGVITSTIPEVPTVDRLNTYSITKTSAVLKGVIRSFGQAPLDSFGVCWSTHPDPTKEDHVQLVSLVNGVFNFNTTISGLEPNTLYYIRSFTTTDYGTVYATTNTLLKTYYGTVTDYDGNTYYTVKIGEMEWMAENLNVTRFNDGTPLQYASSSSSWYGTSQAAYSENSTESIYGNFYNWYCAYNSKNIAPVGWHVPTKNDWELFYSLTGGGSNSNAVKIQGNEYWYTPNSATNESGFSAIGTGYRYTTGNYTSQLSVAYFWADDFYYACMQIASGSYMSLGSVGSPLNGLNIRCVKD
jgi:uncharacterized protein (TIGR02145 family)